MSLIFPAKVIAFPYEGAVYRRLAFVGIDNPWNAKNAIRKFLAASQQLVGSEGE